MKSICIDARMINSAGIGRYIRSLLKGFINSKHKIYLITNKKLINEYEWLNHFEIIHSDIKIYSIKEQILLPFLIPKCDLFFSPHFNIPFFKIRAKKRITTIHDVFHLAFENEFSFLEKIYAKFFINQAIKKSKKVITVSNFSKKEILKYTNHKKEKIKVIHNGIDLDDFTYCEDPKRIKKIKKELNLPEKYFLFVGNLKKHKNLKNLIKAFEKIQKEEKDIFLVIVGNNKNIKNAFNIDDINLIQKQIIWLSQISDDQLKIIYQLSLALVFPSLYEGFGYPPLEAIALKSAAIVSNEASLPEVCEKAAIYVKPLDIDDISKAMKKVLNEKFRRELILKSQNTIEKFKLENCIKKHLELFDEILNESK